MGILYVVSTPIGNLEDITLRAIRILGEVETILCEDTRKTGNLIKKLGIVSPAKFLSYYEANEASRIPQVIKLLEKGQKAALVSSAGTPAISDPGFKLIREAIKKGKKVVPVPGCSAVLTALVASGLPTDKFLFLGFLPKKEGKRKKILTLLAERDRKIKTTVIIYESPFRLLKTLKEILETIGNVEIAVCRELTKIHEEIIREKAAVIYQNFKAKQIKGELTILIKLNI